MSTNFSYVQLADYSQYAVNHVPMTFTLYGGFLGRQTAQNNAKQRNQESDVSHFCLVVADATLLKGTSIGIP